MESVQFVFLLGIAAGTCTTLSFLPQIRHLWIRRSADDISTPMFVTFSIGSLLWTLYGFGIRSIPVIIPNAITLVLNLNVLFLKWKFTRSRPTVQSETVR